MMTKVVGTALVLVGVAVAAGPVSAQEAAANAPTGKSARATLLDKQTNRRETLILVSGQPQTVGSLSVMLTKCLPDYAARLGQDVAWLDITENVEGKSRAASWFSGWMFNTYPEVSTLDHPRYDVILQGCGTKARKIVQATASAPVLDESGPPLDTESSDPYTVPGVKDESEPMPQTVEDDVSSRMAPVAQPVEAAPAAQDQQDLHQLMDSGTY